MEHYFGKLMRNFLVGIIFFISAAIIEILSNRYIKIRSLWSIGLSVNCILFRLSVWFFISVLFIRGHIINYFYSKFTFKNLKVKHNYFCFFILE